MVLVCFSLWAVNVALISFAHCYRPLTLTFTHCYHPLTATKHLVAITLNNQLNWTVNKCLVEHLCLCSCWYSDCEIYIFSLDLKKKASSCPPAHACRSAYSKADGSKSIQKQMDPDAGSAASKVALPSSFLTLQLVGSMWTNIFMFMFIMFCKNWPNYDIFPWRIIRPYMNFQTFL